MAKRAQSYLAIDFGTTTSLVARREGKAPATVLQLAPTTNWLPSVAAFEGGRYTVGEEADSAPLNLIIRSVKRAITLRKQTVPLGGVEGNQEVSADEAIAAILELVRLRALDAGRALARMKQIRMGCPAMWDGDQRKRLVDIAAGVGLPVSGATLIDEPIAAGMAWLSYRQAQAAPRVGGRLLVFDMGGGTLDIAVLDIGEGDPPPVTVLASRGVELAGDKLDERIAGDFAAELFQKGWQPLGSDSMHDAFSLLRVSARAAKELLSNSDSTAIALNRRTFGVGELRYTRDQLEERLAPLLETAEREIFAALAESRLRERFRESTMANSVKPERLAADINYVLLTGGMSQIPYIRRYLKLLFPHAEIASHSKVDPVEAVAIGLTDTSGYDRINLYRPGFDFVLRFNGEQRTLYRAHTPLYEAWQITNGHSRLSYEMRGSRLDLPRRGHAELVAVSPTGELLPMSIDGRQVDRLSVKLGYHDLIFRLYCDGQILLTDGSGIQRALRIGRWPIITGSDDGALELQNLPKALPDPPHPWFLDGEDYLPPKLRSPRGSTRSTG